MLPILNILFILCGTILSGAVSIQTANAEPGNTGSLDFWSQADQEVETKSFPSQPSEMQSQRSDLAWQKREFSNRIEGNLEVERIEAEHIHRLVALPSYVVRTSIKEFLPRNPEAFSDLYFDGNRSLIRDKDSETLEKIAHSLRVEPESELILDAYCDERGAGAYSLILGDKRARQVQTFFMHLGLPQDRMSRLSYGSEQVWCREQSASCWEANLLVKHVFRLMAPHDPQNGCLVRLALTAGSYRSDDSSQFHRRPPLLRLRLSHAP